MIIGVPKETDALETRCALTPPNAARLVSLGAAVQIENGVGSGSGFGDVGYVSAGATVANSRPALLAAADMLLRVRKPPIEEVEMMKPGAMHLSFLDPFKETELVRNLASRGISAFSLEMLPRITRAQKMDALTSQANLAGYGAV